MTSKKNIFSTGNKAIYTGNIHPYLKGYTVMIGKPILDDNNWPTGRIEVFPWIEKDKRFSWIASDALLDDLKPITE